MLSKRPKPGETEEDILQLQEEFSKWSDSVKTASATVVRLDKRTKDVDCETASSSKPESDDASAVGSKRLKTGARSRSVTFAGGHLTSPLLIDGPPLDTVLCHIMERDTRTSKASPPNINNVGGRSFPTVHRCDPKELLRPRSKTVDGIQAPSIFAQRMRATRKEPSASFVIEKPGTSSTRKCELSRSAEKHEYASDDSSRVVDGTGLDPSRSEHLAREIHVENLVTLSGMSVDEIFEQRNRLVESLDPKILEFVRSRRHAKKVSEEVVDQMESTTESVTPDIFVGFEPRKWLNMDKVETDKLAWTRPLDDRKLPLDPESGHRARFDFDGALVPRESDVPVHRGLHHHGDEPEMAGYTLEELFTYGRSSIQQQRVLALTTLARVLQRNGEGDHDRYLCDATQFLPQMLDSGLVLLLRWALDDNTESCLAATVAAIHGLLVRTSDEYFLDETFCWSRGHEQPYLRPKRNEKNEKERVDDEEPSDAELVAMDVVRGLVRMDVLPRLRYVLEVIRPESSPAIVLHSLAILVRLARHSPQMANAVADCPRLIETVVREFLPKSWTTQGETVTSVYGVPVRQAVRLLRTLASTGRRLAGDLLRRHELMTSLLCYASADPSDFVGRQSSHVSELLQLSLEAYRTWTVFLHYGLAVEYFSDFYPLIVRQLRFCHSLCLNVDVRERTFDCNYASELIGLVTAVIGPLTSDVDGGSSASWNLLLPLHLPIELCLKKWLWEMAHADDTTSSSLKLIGVTLTFVATFYEAMKLSAAGSMDVAARLDDLFSLAVVSFLGSNGLRNQLDRLSESSALLCERQPASDRDVPSLPSLGSLLGDGRLQPVLSERSPHPLLGHLVRALLVLGRVHTPLRHQFSGPLSANEEIASYLRRLSSSSSTVDDPVVRSNWFARFEAQFVADLMALFVAPDCHGAAVTVLLRLQSGDEALAVQLLTSVIFNEDFLRRVDDVRVELQHLRIGDVEPSSVSVSRADLVQRTRSVLTDIRSTYSKAFSKSRTGSRLLMVDHSREPIVPLRFEYSPIADPFFADDSSNAVGESDMLTAIVHCLQWCHLVQCYGDPARMTVTPESRFCYLAMVTVIGADIFLDSRVRCYLRDSLLMMGERGELHNMNLDSKPIPEMASFHDFYEQMLLQFEAVSYGDHLFGMFVLVPLQMSHPVRLRRTLWSSEHRSALRALGVRPDELSIPLSTLLDPVETDAILLDCYFSALSNGYVRPGWCPILYLVAVHHVHSFLFSGADAFAGEKYRNQMREMFKRLRTCGEASDVYKHVTLYAGPNRTAPLCFDLADSPRAEVTTKLLEVNL